MRKAESLSKLAEWAEAARDDARLYPSSALKPLNSADAVRHGLAAVRAIQERKWEIPGLISFDPEIIADFARSESRLAFRSALRAVGIQGAL